MPVLHRVRVDFNILGHPTHNQERRNYPLRKKQGICGLNCKVFLHMFFSVANLSLENVFSLSKVKFFIHRCFPYHITDMGNDLNIFPISMCL